jgi:hypothetical protein
LLVYDDEDVIMLVEVKTRGQSPPIMNAEEINNLKEFWNDSILVLLVPDGNFLYAKKVEEMEREPEHSYLYYPLSNFKEFQDIFARVHPDDIKHYRGIVLEMLKIFMSEKKALESTLKP